MKSSPTAQLLRSESYLSVQQADWGDVVTSSFWRVEKNTRLVDMNGAKKQENGPYRPRFSAHQTGGGGQGQKRRSRRTLRSFLTARGPGSRHADEKRCKPEQ